jgi:hypothetical protein
VLIALYCYFHLYLNNLWRDLAILPAIFPDGKPLNRTAYPWLLNSIVCRHFSILKKRPVIFHMKEWVTIILAWWVVPVTLMAFWLRYIPRHHWVGTIFHIGLIILSVAFAIIFYRLCSLTLQGRQKVVFRFRNFWSDKRFYYAVSVVVVGILFSLLSYGAIEYAVFADFREKEVSERPINYWEISKDKRLESVKGANLKGRNLKNANMDHAFLAKADLRRTLLKSALLIYANLQKAKLTDANLQQAKLEGAKLQNADLTGAKNLTIDQLSKVKTLYKAILDPEILKQVKECCPHLLEEPKEEAVEEPKLEKDQSDYRNQNGTSTKSR